MYVPTSSQSVCEVTSVLVIAERHYNCPIEGYARGFKNRRYGLWQLSAAAAHACSQMYNMQP